MTQSSKGTIDMDLLLKEIHNGNLQKINKLIDETAIPQNHKWMDYKLVKSALRLRKKSIAKLFIEKGFRVKKFPVTISEDTPLHLAVNAGYTEIIEILLKKGASVEVYNLNKETPLILAIKQQKYLIADLLLSYIGLEDCYNNEFLSHMHIACMQNRVDIVKKFLQDGSFINLAIRSKSIRWAGYTPLHFAVEFGCIEVVNFLLNCGADITIHDERKQTPLHLAYELHNEEIIDLILLTHTYVLQNPKNSEELTHFHIACTRNNSEIVKNFLQYKIDSYHKMIQEEIPCYVLTRPSFNALYFAIENECTDVIKVLLDYGADISSPDYPLSVSHLAYKTGNPEIINLIQKKLNSKDTTVKYLPKLICTDLSLDGFIQRMFNKSCKNNNNKNLTELHKAILKNNDETIDRFLSSGNNDKSLLFNWPPSWPGCTPLHLAVYHGNSKAVDLLIKLGADITAMDARNMSPLYIAFKNKKDDIIDRILLAHDCTQKNPVNTYGLSHFHISCTRKNLNIIKHFLTNGVNINESVDYDSPFWPGCTPLHFAVKHNLSDVVKLLIDNGADITKKDGMQLTPLDHALKYLQQYAEISKHDDEYEEIDYTIIEILLKTQELKKFDSFNDRGFSLLHIACAKNDDINIKPYLLCEYLNKTVDLNSPIFAGFTPLHFATYADNDTAIKILTRNGANVSARDAEGNTPLHVYYLHHVGKLGYKTLILCPENPIGKDMLSHFHIACKENNLEAVKYFLKQGVDVNEPLSYDVESFHAAGRSPLHYAVISGNKALVKFLIDNGADVNARDIQWNTPLHFCHNASIETIKLLIKLGADVNALNVTNENPFATVTHLNIFGQLNPQVLTVLLDSGADINLEFDMSSRMWDSKPNYLVIIMKHVKKLMVLGYYVSEMNQIAYARQKDDSDKNYFNEIEFASKCQMEIDEMTKVKINKCTTLKDILFKNTSQMIQHAKNPTLKQIINSKNFNNKYPLYGYLLKLKLKMSLARIPLIEPAKMSLKILSKYDICNPCLEMIFEHLSEKDLQNLIDSTKNET